MICLPSNPQQQTPMLETLTDRELYRLSFLISEVLVSREQVRLTQPLVALASHDNADDNYGAW